MTDQPTREAIALHRRKAIAVELAGHFALRPWADMASDRAHLRTAYRENTAADVPWDINEPTHSDCFDAADAVIALSTPIGEPADIVLVSTTSEAGFETHGLFASMDDALAHVCKDEDQTLAWERGDMTRQELRAGKVFWCASRQPVRNTTPQSAIEQAVADERERELVEALKDMLSGWRYIRAHYGDLGGVGWDRCEVAAIKALAAIRATPEVQS